MHEIVPATADHARYIAARLRQADQDEVAASTRLPAGAAVLLSLEISQRAFVALEDGEPVVIWGIVRTSLIGGVGCPWLLATAAIERVPVRFLRAARRALIELCADYCYLRNHVDARNTTSIHWLRWLGFTIHPAVPHGPMGLPFHPFEMVT